MSHIFFSIALVYAILFFTNFCGLINASKFLCMLTCISTIFALFSGDRSNVNPSNMYIVNPSILLFQWSLYLCRIYGKLVMYIHIYWSSHPLVCRIFSLRLFMVKYVFLSIKHFTHADASARWYLIVTKCNVWSCTFLLC